MMRQKALIWTIAAASLLTLILSAYSFIFRHYLDGDRFLVLALQAAGNDPAIINADEPEFTLDLDDGRLVIEFVFQTALPDGVGSIALKIDPFRNQAYDVKKRDYYVSPGG